MPGSARIFDMWVGACLCCGGPSAGIIIMGSPNVFTNTPPNTARLFDLTICFMLHPGFICKGSPNVYVNNLKSARKFDLVCICNIGIIITASPNVKING